MADLKQKAREWHIAEHRKRAAKIANHNKGGSCLVCNDGWDVNWHTEEVADFAAQCVAEEREAYAKMLEDAVSCRSDVAIPQFAVEMAAAIRARKGIGDPLA